MADTCKILANSINPNIWVDEYRESLFKYAIARLRDADLAEENIQETFLAALKSGENFKGLASEKTWLISILKRKIYDHFRRVSRDRHFNEATSVQCLSNDTLATRSLLAERSHAWLSDPSKAYEQKELSKLIWHALSELPNRLAQVFILREIIEFSSEEICELMGISIDNLYVMIYRARKRLRQSMQLEGLI